MTRMDSSPDTTARPWARRLLQPRAIGTVVTIGVLIAAAMSTTVVRDEDAVATEVFSAEEFAAEHYDDIIEPGIEENSVDLVELLGAIEADEQNAKDTYGNSSNPNNAYSYPVTVTGVVGEPTETSIPLEVDGVSSDIAVSVQLAQIRGSALRDVTGSVDLNSFLNQVEYLNVSLELNEAARARVIAPFLSDNPLDGLEGATLTVTGAFLNDTATAVEIVPIAMEVQ